MSFFPSQKTIRKPRLYQTATQKDLRVNAVDLRVNTVQSRALVGAIPIQFDNVFVPFLSSRAINRNEYNSQIDSDVAILDPNLRQIKNGLQ